MFNFLPKKVEQKIIFLLFEGISVENLPLNG